MRMGKLGRMEGAVQGGSSVFMKRGVTNTHNPSSFPRFLGLLLVESPSLVVYWNINSVIVQFGYLLGMFLFDCLRCSLRHLAQQPVGGFNL